jgi:methionyl-tRNA formyltransferase
MEKIVIATIKSWDIKNALRFKERNKNKYDVLIIIKKEDLIYSRIKKINPRYIFFPHWSWIIPKEIYENFEGITFHMTDLPFGRGGSPLQNLILRGIKRTKISAIRVVKDLDTGPIYLKKPLSLNGSAEEIYKRASQIIFEEMIPYIIEKNPKPVPQKGGIVIFKRRKPEESKIPDNITIEEVYDYIRMLDAEGYPPAFLETKNLVFEFKNAKKEKNLVKAEVYIREKNK